MSFLNPQAKLLHQGETLGKWIKTGRTIPVLVEIAPTGYCNAKCPWCFFKDNRGKEIIDKKTMENALKEMAETGLKAVNWTGGGEPTLHPNFSDFVKIANKFGLKQGLFTNAYKKIPNQEMFDWIRISMTDKGFKPIKKPKVSFGICVNLTKNTLVEKWCKEAKEFGASYFQIRPALIGDYKKQPKLKPPTDLKKYETNKFKVLLTPYKFEEATKPRVYDKCYGYHFCPSIDWRGRLGVCLYMMGHNRFILGDLNKNSFREIWRKIPEEILVIKECQNCCKNHEINKILFAAKNLEHIDFL